MRLGCPGSKPTASSCGPSSSERAHDNARRAGAEANHLTLVRRAARTAGAAEVQRLEQVRLAGAVGPGDHGQALAELDLGMFVAAEVAQAYGQHAASPTYTFRRMGMIR